MNVVATLALYGSFKELQEAGGGVDVPVKSLAVGLYLANMYDDGTISMPQHMLAVVVGDDVPSKWQVVRRWSSKSPVGKRDIITIKFDPDTIPLYVGGDKIDAVAQQAVGLPIYEVHSLYSPRCHCVYLS